MDPTLPGLGYGFELLSASFWGPLCYLIAHEKGLPGPDGSIHAIACVLSSGPGKITAKGNHGVCFSH